MPRRIFDIDSGIDRDVDALGDRFASALERSISAWYRDAAVEIGRLQVSKRVPGALTPTQPRLKSIARQLAFGMQQGPTDTVARHLKQMTVLTRQTLEGLRAGGVTRDLTARHLGILDKFYQTRQSHIRGVLLRVGVEAATTLRQAALTQQQVGEVLVEIREHADDAIRKAKTLYESSLMEYVQLATGVVSEPDDVFLYSGPIDARIRPFCSRVVARVWSRKSIDKMDNKQLPNTFLTRGGYNCRHVWRPVRDPKLVKLADTGQIVPGYSSVLQSAIKAASKGVRRRTA